MKKLYLLPILFLFAKNSSAQQYYPMLDSVNDWHFIENYVGVRLAPNAQSGPCSYPIWTSSPYSDYTTVDTAINSMTYKTLINGEYGCTLGYLREDTAARKVYFVDDLLDPELLLYDFSMVVGDSISINFLSNGMFGSGYYRLDAITQIHTASGWHREFRLNCHTCFNSPTLRWIEGIGNPEDIIYPLFNNAGNQGNLFYNCQGEQYDFYQFLACFSHNSKIYYDSCALYQATHGATCLGFVDSCNYGNVCGAINEYNFFASMDIFPNPSYGKTTLSLDIKHSGSFEILVHDISGKKILKDISLGKIQEGKKDVELDLTSLTDGFYLVELKTEEGSVYRKLLIEK